MKKMLAAALLGAAMTAATPAMAATVLYDLKIEANGNTDSPFFTLTNTSTYTGPATGADALSAFLTSVKLTYSGSTYIDRLFDFTNPSPQTTPGITRDIVYPDVSQNDQGTKGFLINFGGFNPTDSTRFKADFDLADGSKADFRNILNGAVLEVGFADGTTLTKTLSGFNAQTLDYNFTGGERIAGGGTPSATAVPEPATWAMMILGFGVIGMNLRSRPRRKTALTAA